MRIRRSLAIFSAALIVAAASALPAAAAVRRSAPLPEQAGLYDVPGRPHQKLRVIVYHAKPDGAGAKPGSGSPPSLACAASAAVDPDSSAVPALAPWKLPATYEYRLNAASVPSTVGAANAAAVASNSYDAWLSASADLSASVEVSSGAPTSIDKAQRDDINVVAWGRTSGSALATTYIWYDTVTGVALEIDTIMNKRFTWHWSDPSSWPEGQQCAYGGVYDAQNILTHEIGHTFGLDDEYASDFTHNTMYGYGDKGETKKNSPSSGDVAGMNARY